MREYSLIRQVAKPKERIVGVRGVSGVTSPASGGKGRFAAQRMRMSPMHSSGPCLHSIAEDWLDTLERE